MKTTNRYNPNTFNALHAGLAFLAYWAVTLLIALGLFLVLNGVGTVENAYPYYCLELILNALGLGGLTWLFSRLRRCNPIDGGGFLVRKGCGTELLMAAVLALGMAAVFAPLADSFAVDYEIFRIALKIKTTTLPTVADSAWGYLYTYLLLPFLPAICEELFFRGVIARGLLEWGKLPAVLISAVVFSLAHGSADRLVYQFLFGIALAFVYFETKNLLVPIFAHLANNLYSTWGQLPSAMLGKGLSFMAYDSLIGMFSVLFGFVCLISAFIYFGKRFVLTSRREEKTRGDVRATFLERTSAGETFVLTPWYDCGNLSENAESKIFLSSGKKGGRVAMNGKSNRRRTVFALVLGGAFALTKIILTFLSIL